MGEHASVCVIAKRWHDYGSSTDVDRYKYGYDRASNRIWKENTVSKAQTTPVYLDELYTYDGLHRLKTFDRGELNSAKTAITGTPAKEEDWTLDALGNWSGYIQMTAGTTDLNQQRSANAVNEIADITESVGTSWVTSVFHSEISSAGGLLNVSRVRSNHSTLRMSGRMRD
ncbi:MAG: hypothetical protein KDA62_11935 [Planctomycetales bacterium]|nr:hypothetical protein [Planctomycetales bacterium]